MADSNSNAQPSELNRNPLFIPFKWHRNEVEKAQLPGERVMHFVANARDTAAGIAAVLEIIDHDNASAAFDERPLLTGNQRSALQRLAQLAAFSLNEEAERIAQWGYDYHTPEGIAQRKETFGA